MSTGNVDILCNNCCRVGTIPIQNNQIVYLCHLSTSATHFNVLLLALLKEFDALGTENDAEDTPKVWCQSDEEVNHNQVI